MWIYSILSQWPNCVCFFHSAISVFCFSNIIIALWMNKRGMCIQLIFKQNIKIQPVCFPYKTDLANTDMCQIDNPVLCLYKHQTLNWQIPDCLCVSHQSALCILMNRNAIVSICFMSVTCRKSASSRPVNTYRVFWHEQISKAVTSCWMLWHTISL